MWMLVIRGLIAGAVIVAVTVLANRYPRIGALLLTLPLISVIAFISTWQRQHDLTTISRLARETLVLVPLGLPFFVPLAFAPRLGIGFWPAFALGLVFAWPSLGLGSGWDPVRFEPGVLPLRSLDGIPVFTTKDLRWPSIMRSTSARG